MRSKWLLIILLILSACSSIKIPECPQAKIDADNQLRFASQLESTKDYSAAGESYNFLLNSYRSFADVKGMLNCLSGLARIALEENDDKAYLEKRMQMTELIQTSANELNYYLLLLDIYYYQRENDLVAISEKAIITKDLPWEVSVNLATAKLQADSFLGTATGKQVQELNTLSNKLEKQLKKGKNANNELLSSAWYALAYYYFRNSNYKNAYAFAHKAQELDYRYGNFSGMAHCLWLKGQIAFAENKISEAQSNWKKAEGIFISLNDTQALQKLRQDINKLPQEQMK